jgi:citrate synthase
LIKIVNVSKIERMTTLIDAPPGLEGIVVAETAIGDVRGHEGYFHYRGHAAPALAASRSVEEVWHLVHAGHLPDDDELRRFAQTTAELRPLAPQARAALAIVAAAGSPMAALRTLTSLAGQNSRSWLDLAPPDRAAEALRLVAAMPAAVAGIWRTQRGLPRLDPDPRLGLAEDYLRQISGAPPPASHVRALERYLILTIDHGFNASTFTARVVASTGADLTAAIVAAMGALSGPLHGGAPALVLDMLDEIEEPARARAWAEESLASGRRIMGFGHRVYRTEDPRSALLKQTALELGGPVVELAVEVERVVLELLEHRYPERKLRTNVEFYAGVVLHQIGLPPALFTPTFAVSRTIGWTAHVLEQTVANRIIRPSSRYVGMPPDA